MARASAHSISAVLGAAFFACFVQRCSSRRERTQRPQSGSEAAVYQDPKSWSLALQGHSGGSQQNCEFGSLQNKRVLAEREKWPEQGYLRVGLPGADGCIPGERSVDHGCPW